VIQIWSDKPVSAGDFFTTVINQLKRSIILLLMLAGLFSIPIVTVGYTVHGLDLALLAAVAVPVLVVMGPLSFLFASTLATHVELMVIAILGVALVFGWAKGLARGGEYGVPYFPVVGWSLLGAYFCVSLYFAHAIK
jgi:hypothetical protein